MQFDEALVREQTNLSAQLANVDQQIADLKNHANIISLEEARKNLANQISQIQTSVMDARAELAECEAAMKLAGSALPEGSVITNTAPPLPVPRDQINAYNLTCTRLSLLRKKEQDYLMQGFTESSVLVREVEVQLASVEKSKADFEKTYPQLLGMGATSAASGGQLGSPASSLQAQIRESAGLQAKLKTWNEKLNQLQTETTNLNSLEPILAQLQQVRTIYQANLEGVAKGLEQSRISEAINAGQTPNIKELQSPSPPFQSWKKTYKKMAALAGGGIFGGIALAFLIELLLDRSIRRPAEIVTKLKLPLFLSIPDIKRNGNARLLKTAERRQLRWHNAQELNAPADADGSPQPKNGTVQVVSLEHDSVLQPFYEALRDRLIVYFEVRNLTHKPKLVAVTSANRGAGVSSIAAGLAASLSETGDGNVLLVDMNQEQGSAQQFYKGKAGCGLDTALKAETKEEALVQEHLYVVNGNANSAELPRILPKRFAALVPKLKASDYDYIIFDMPPVSQTSLTSRLSRFMDMTLMVIESEKSDREVVQQANKWLTESGATVGAVLNKTRKYIPSTLVSDFNSES